MSVGSFAPYKSRSRIIALLWGTIFYCCYQEPADAFWHCKLTHFDLELSHRHIYLRWNISECLTYMQDSTADFQVLLCEESSNNCINQTCHGRCNETHFNRTDCGYCCTMDVRLKLTGWKVQPSPCFKLCPEVYENNSQMYSDDYSDNIKLTKMPCSEISNHPHHLLLFNGGESALNSDDPRIITSQSDNIYCVSSLNESNSLAIVEYCEKHLDYGLASNCEQSLGCPNRPAINLILFNSRTVICSGYHTEGAEKECLIQSNTLPMEMFSTPKMSDNHDAGGADPGGITCTAAVIVALISLM